MTGSIAPLKNVSTCVNLLESLVNRGADLPGLGVFSGPSGFGKSFAGQYAQNRSGAIYIETRDYWTKKVFCQKLLIELGEKKTGGTIASLMDRIIDLVTDDLRPIIIDEADRLIDKKIIELVRDIHDIAFCPILLIGEEELRYKIESFERVANRVLDWQLAQPCDEDDCRILMGLVCPKITIADDLVRRVCRETQGRARRIAVAAANIGRYCQTRGLGEIDASDYSEPIATGAAPTRRNAAGRSSSVRPQPALGPQPASGPQPAPGLRAAI